MIGVSLNAKSVQDTLKKLNRYGKKVHKLTGNQVQKSTVNIHGGAVGRCSVRTGRLRSSIHKNVDKPQLHGEVGTNVHYSPYAEFGTGSLVEVPSELKEYAIQFKGKGIRQVNLPARPFLFPSVEEEKPNYENGLKNILKTAHR